MRSCLRTPGRAWKVSRPFLAAWAVVTLVVLAVYPHHILMDFVMPKWAAVLGQVLSYVSGIPVLLVTTWGLLASLHHSGVKWELPLRLLVFGVLGWSIGVIPAIVDATIQVNLVMHNTLWVPGHFHLYLLLGLLPMLLGTLVYATTRENWRESSVDRAMFWIYGVAGLVFCMMFLCGWRARYTASLCRACRRVVAVCQNRCGKRYASCHRGPASRCQGVKTVAARRSVVPPRYGKTAPRDLGYHRHVCRGVDDRHRGRGPRHRRVSIIHARVRA